jgi:hypothetical protein
MRDQLADLMIQLGFWCQIVFLGLVDWGSAASFRRQGVPWYHAIGFAVVNLVLIAAAVLTWRYLSRQRARRAEPADVVS